MSSARLTEPKISMPELYTRPVWSPHSPTEAFELIDRAVIGVFVTFASTGFAVSHLPFLLARTRGQNGTLTSHLAAANDHAALIESGASSVAVFRAEHGYISPSWYPANPVRDSAPTWNFAVVHCHGRPEPMTTQKTARHLIDLVEHMEDGRANRWRASELGKGGMERRLPNVLGFELPIERFEAKFKMGQDERLPDTRGAIEALRVDGEAGLADLMERHNQDR
jgi:transcriptional regulator